MALKKKISDQEIVAAAIEDCDRLSPYTWGNSTNPQKVAWILKTRNKFRGIGIDVPYLTSVERLLKMAETKHYEEKHRQNDLMCPSSDDEDNDGFNPFGSGPEPIGRRVGQ